MAVPQSSSKVSESLTWLTTFGDPALSHEEVSEHYVRSKHRCSYCVVEGNTSIHLKKQNMKL